MVVPIERDTLENIETFRKYTEVLARRFIQQPDIHAIQHTDGRYICIRRAITLRLLQQHLEGKITLGTYVLNQANKTKYLVLDADTEEIWEHMVHMCKDLTEKRIPCYLETSRRGGHAWFFFPNLLSGATVRSFADDLMWTYGLSDLEVYPKQDVLRSGPGSLIRLPFGVHRVANRRFGFITPEGTVLAPTIREQIDMLGNAETIPNYAFELVQRPKRVREQKSREITIYEANEAVSSQIKRAITVLEFVSQYVDLSRRGRGRCPFHDDTNPSFGVDDKRNYWHCFAGCGGGSIIDFWMQWQRCDFKTAVKELAHMLL